MSSMSMPLPSPPRTAAEYEAALAAMQRHHEGELAERDAALARMQVRLEELHAEMQLALARRFGASSEKVADAQLGLFNEVELEADGDDAPGDGEESSVDDDDDKPRRARRRGGRRPLPSHLPRVVVTHELAPDERVCPTDGTALEVTGYEESERLRIIPARFEVIVTRRAKYACTRCRAYMATTPAPVELLAKSMATPELLAYIATAKFLDALPLYRQQAQFSRIGVELSRQTMARWMIRLAQRCTPIINLLRERLLEQQYIQMDETRLQVLKEPGKAATSLSQLWVQRGMDPQRPVVLFTYRPDRRAATASELLEGFTGELLQTDGYAGYDGVGRARGRVHALCLAHARRRFTDGLKALGINPQRVPPKPKAGVRQLLKGLSLIRGLYAIERRIRGCSAEERLRVRQDCSVPALERLRVWVTQTRPKASPSSHLGAALRYLDNHWEGLVAYASDGRLEIDTNLVENEIRPFAIGRANWKFADTPAGATASADLYTLVVNARLNGLDPYGYLVHVARTLPHAASVDDIEALLPCNLTPQAIAVS